MNKIFLLIFPFIIISCSSKNENNSYITNPTNNSNSILTKVSTNLTDNWSLSFSSSTENYENVAQHGYKNNSNSYSVIPGRPSSGIWDLVDIWTSGTYWRASAGRRWSQVYGIRSEVRQKNGLVWENKDRVVNYNWLYSFDFKTNDVDMYDELITNGVPTTIIVGQVFYKSSSEITHGTGGEGGMWTIGRSGSYPNYGDGLRYAHSYWTSSSTGSYETSNYLLTMSELEIAEINGHKIRLVVTVNYSSEDRGWVIATATVEDGEVVVKSSQDLIYVGKRNMWNTCIGIPYWKGGIYAPPFWANEQTYTIRIHEGNVY